MILRGIIELFFKLLIYGLFFSGVYVLVRPYLMPTVEDILMTYKTRARLRNFKTKQYMDTQRESLFYRHLDMLIQSTWRFYTDKSTMNFIIITVGLFLASISVFIKYTSSLFISGSAAVITALTPYLVMRIYLHILRSKTSYELIPATTILLGNYRVCNRDLYFAITETIKKLDDLTLKKAFIILAQNIQKHKNTKDIEQAIELFVFKIQTAWAKQLGILFLNSLVEGKNIEGSLSNLVDDMKEGQNVIEEEKSNSQETIYLGFFPIIAFPFTLLVMINMSNRFNILHYQFSTKSGLSSFIIVTLLCIVSAVISILLRRPKNDI